MYLSGCGRLYRVYWFSATAMLSDGFFIPPMILFVPCGFWIIGGFFPGGGLGVGHLLNLG